MMTHYIIAGRGLAAAVFVLLVLSLGNGAPARADSIVYDLTGAGRFVGFSLQYTSPAFVLSPLTVPLASLDSCTPGAFFCGDVQFHPPSLASANAIYDIIDDCTITDGCLVFYFPLGAFSAVGSYTDIHDDATLTISTTPEPSTWLLLGTVLLGLTAMIWQRKRLA